MRITGKFMATAATVLVLCAPGFAQETPTKETVLATVNGTDITLGHVLALANRLPDQYMGVEDKNLYAGIVDQLVQQQLLSDLIKEETADLKLAGENEHRALFATEAIEGIYAAALTKEAVNERYAAVYLNAEAIPEFSTSHILVGTEKEAKAIVAQLAEGADFAELAKEKSTGPSGPGGGSLGWAGKGSFVPEFEAAMIGLEVGAVSAPVKTQFGWHVIKLNETRNQPAPKLDVVRDEIEDGLRAEALDKRISELEAAGNVERKDQDIDPSFVKKFELLKD
jgi:peptidyl-prolyl cis-trans isomerase C